MPQSSVIVTYTSRQIYIFRKINHRRDLQRINILKKVSKKNQQLKSILFILYNFVMFYERRFKRDTPFSNIVKEEIKINYTLHKTERC